MSVDPTVSIVLTAYNAQDLLPATLRSLRRQSYSDFECLVVDDGSTDNTAAVVTDFSDPRFILIRAGRVGRGRALNIGLQAAKGQYVAIQDADDLSHPQRLEIQLSHLKKNQAAVLGSDQKILESLSLDETLADWPLQIGDVRDVSQQLLFKNPLSHTSLMVSRQCLQNIGGYDESRKNLFDWDLLLRLHLSGEKILHYSEPLVLKRIHPGQFFEVQKRLSYVKNCLHLQNQARRDLRRSTIWILVFWALFVYRLLPWSLRRQANQLFGSIKK